MKLAFWKKKKIDSGVELEKNSREDVSTVNLKYDDIGLKHSIRSKDKTDADFYWESLVDEEIAYQIDHTYVLPWEELFYIQKDPEHDEAIKWLNLPESNELYPIVRSENGLSDTDFKIILDGWGDKSKTKVKGRIQRSGAIVIVDGKEHLLNEPSWRLIEKIKEFSKVSEKDRAINQKFWAQIRSLANKSEANLDEFLRKTIVLAPNQLQLNLRKNLVSNESVVEIQPDFDEAPSNWLQSFDSYNEVQDQYTISLPEGGLAHIIIEPEVKSVLSEIKKMPHRRISGERAQTFLHNPFAQLGSDALEVITPESFEESKKEAEIYSYRIQIEKTYDALSNFSTAQLILSENSDREQAPVILELSNLEQAQYFVNAYEKASPVFLWAGYNIDRTNYLDIEIDALKEDLKKIKQYEEDLQTQEVLDLSNYSDRVIGIGEAEALSSGAIQKDSGESGWLPQSLIEGPSSFTRTDTDNSLIDTEELAERIKRAEIDNESFVLHPETNTPIALDDAKTLLNELQQLKKEAAPAEVEGHESAENDEVKKKSTLLIASNIDEAEFTKKRVETLFFDDNNVPPARLPSSFRNQEFNLKKHQEYGVAWLQNLYQYAPVEVSGCLLADDMGLGKTLQLLCFIGEILEKAEDKKPALIVAPVSLLENWERCLST